MLSPLDLSLINGPIPVTATVAGVLALAALTIRRNRTWWTRIELFTNNRVGLDEATKPASSVVEVPAGGKLADVWRRPADLPEKGTVSEETTPGTFKARPAWIYLPPAYAATPRPRLPVVVLLPGQPGSPRDWFDAGRLTARTGLSR